MGAFSRAFSAARDGVNARRAEGRRPSNDARFDKKTENSIDKHRDRLNNPPKEAVHLSTSQPSR